METEEKQEKEEKEIPHEPSGFDLTRKQRNIARNRKAAKATWDSIQASLSPNHLEIYNDNDD